MQVCVPTTPAQMFHLLRRQLLRPYRKPLVVMSPKSLLRHRLSTSVREDLCEGGFQVLIDEIDAIDPGQVTRLVMCSGKVYYNLLERRAKRGCGTWPSCGWSSSTRFRKRRSGRFSRPTRRRSRSAGRRTSRATRGAGSSCSPGATSPDAYSASTSWSTPAATTPPPRRRLPQRARRAAAGAGGHRAGPRPDGRAQEECVRRALGARESWERRVLGTAHPGSGASWERRILGAAHPGSGVSLRDTGVPPATRRRRGLFGASRRSRASGGRLRASTSSPRKRGRESMHPGNGASLRDTGVPPALVVAHLPAFPRWMEMAEIPSPRNRTKERLR